MMFSIKNAFVLNIFRLFNKFYLLIAPWAKKKKGVRCLLFHQISKEKMDDFRNLLKELDNKFGFITPAAFFSFLEGGPSSSGIKLLLTFDDGFKVDKYVADQILGPMGIKALFFVCPGIIEIARRKKEGYKKIIIQRVFDNNAKAGYDPENFEFMDWEDIRALSREGNIIGVHTMTHRRLSEMNNEGELIEEIVESKKELEKKLSVRVDCFAYPFGDNKSISRDAYLLIKKHYKYCFTGLRGLNLFPNNYSYIFRDSVRLNEPINFTRMFLDGCADLYYRLKMIKLKMFSK